MIDFKDITLQDKDTITGYTMNSCRRNCDLSFSNLCSWRFLYHTKFAIVNDWLVFKFWAGEKLAYMMPVGQGDLKKVLEALIENARQEGQPFCMLGVCSCMREELENIMPGQFTFTADRDYADYIYLRTDLATLKGKKFQAKRNHINKFRNTKAMIRYSTNDQVSAIQGREQALKRAVTNIISNAFAYGKNIAVGLESNNNKLEITVDDDGPGIPADKREDVFKAFYRLDESRNKETGGVGLGLSIARDIITSHGGKIELTDSELGGLRVLISIPL